MVIWGVKSVTWIHPYRARQSVTLSTPQGGLKSQEAYHSLGTIEPPFTLDPPIPLTTPTSPYTFDTPGGFKVKESK